MTYEVALNTRLADFLQSEGIIAKEDERQPNNSLTDIYCYVGDHTIGIEAKQGAARKQRLDAIKDADRNLDEGLCDVGMAIVYPPHMRTRDDLMSGQLDATVRVMGSPTGTTVRWRTVKVADFADFVRQAPNELGSPDALAGIAERAVKTAALKFSKRQQRYILKGMGKSAARTSIEGLLTDVLTAIMFHSKLDAIRYDLTPPPPFWNRRSTAVPH